MRECLDEPGSRSRSGARIYADVPDLGRAPAGALLRFHIGLYTGSRSPNLAPSSGSTTGSGPWVWQAAFIRWFAKPMRSNDYRSVLRSTPIRLNVDQLP